MSTTISLTLTTGGVDRNNWEFYQDDPNLRNLILRADSSTSEVAQTAAGIIWPSVNIPQGVNIVSAYLKLVFADANDDANIDIEANDVDNAALFDTEARIIQRARTAASVPWVADALGLDAYVTSPDIKTVIQEVISRVGWVPGNNLMVGLFGKTNTNKQLTIRRNLDAGKEPILEVTYSSARAKLIVIL